MRKNLIYLLAVIILLPVFSGAREREKKVNLEMVNALRNKKSVLNWINKSSRFSSSRTAEEKSGRMSAVEKKSGIKANLESVPDQVIIKFKTGKGTSKNKADLQAAHKMKEKKHIPLVDIYVYKLQNASEKGRVLEALKKNPLIEYAEPDYMLNIQTAPNDPSFNQLWGLHNTGQTGGTADADINAVDAWDISTGSQNVIVAVIDTGVDYTHQDLAANMWQNPGEIPADGIDNDGNGYIDDIYGINAITGNGDPMDDHSHGTHCSGTIGAVGNDGVGVVGVCWNIEIMALKFLSSQGSGSTSDAITCIYYAINKGAHVLSNSWGGGGYSQALSDAIEAARAAGILFVAAAGNSGSNNDMNAHYPSSYSHDNIIAVAATDHNDQLAYFSCYGPSSVDVAAPGVSIYSTTPGNSYASYSGTSMATPHVAGLAALIKSAEYSLTWSQIKQRILSTVDEKESLQGKIVTNGRVNAFYALTNNSLPLVNITAPQDNAIISGSVLLEADAADGNGVAKVEFYIDGLLKTVVTSSPWQYNWDTTLYTNDNHLIKVMVYDQENRTAQDSINVQVNNTDLPGVVIINPGEGEQVAGAIDIRANAAYDAGLSKVEFYIDDTRLGEDTNEPYEITWDSWEIPNGTHEVIVKAHGTDGKIGQAQVTVTTTNVQLPEAERNALIALYNSTNGDNWYDNTNWKKQDGSFNDPGTEDTWYGVTVENNHVVYLYLAFNDLSGTLPPELGNLSHLQDLALYWNMIGGAIPPELGNLGQLGYLDLDDNELTGAIPPELGNLSQLYELWLNDNNFSGGIPPELGNLANLEYLFLWNSQLSGSIPAELGNLTRLTGVWLESNNLTGSIPSRLGNLSSLKYLSLYYNQLTGTIPPELGNLTQLTYLDLDGNQLSGGIPPELANLSNLQTLWLSDNQLTGGIPAEFGNMSALEYLYLFYNQLSGPIPPELGNLGQLKYLDLEGNDFSGDIPVELANLSNLQTLWLSDNQLTGTIPLELTNLANLKYLFLYYNQLSGTIPVQLGNLGQLVYLDLEGNQFSGDIPPELGNLGNLVVLWLSDNHFSGSIPAEFGNFSQLKRLYLNANLLSGIIPTTLTNLTELTGAYSYVDIGYNALYTGDSGLRAFLNSADPDWESTQTIAPSGVSASALSNSSIEVSWTPIAYTQDPGSYQVYYSTASSGPYQLFGDTIDKSVSSLIVTGLNDMTTYYFVVQSETEPHGLNQNTVISAYSPEVSATTTQPAAIQVVTPNGGEVWPSGTTQEITWTSAGAISNVNISYSTAGANGTYITIAENVENTGNYSWTVPIGDSPECKIRIDHINREPSDTSDGLFTIEPGAEIIVTAPNGGEYWQKSSPQQITWTYQKVTGQITIQLYKENSFVLEIGTADVNSGSLTWNIPADCTDGEDYRVRIFQGSIEDYSDDYLSIREPGNHPDFNLDGNVDILWRNTANGINRVWYMNNTTRLGIASPGTVADTGWEIAGTGDFNNDGKIDILWRYYGSDTVKRGRNKVWYMNGVTRIGASGIPRVANTDWKIEGTGDFNNDGSVDILWRYYGPETNSKGKNIVWYMKGVTRISGAALPTRANLNWKINGIGDFNNDGHVDILWRYYGPETTTKGRNQVWYLNGVTKIGATAIPRLANTDWKINAVGDFNNDGNADILWRYYGPVVTIKGKILLWHMKGVIKISSTMVSQVTNLAWEIVN